MWMPKAAERLNLFPGLWRYQMNDKSDEKMGN